MLFTVFFLLFTFCWGGIIIVSIQYNRAGLVPMYLGRVFVAFTGFFVFTFFFIFIGIVTIFEAFFMLDFEFFFYIASQIYERPKGSNKNLCFSRKTNLKGSDLKMHSKSNFTHFFFITNFYHFFRSRSEQFSTK